MTSCSFSQSPPERRYREMRAAWVTTVYQLDYPKFVGTNRIAITEQYRQLIKQLKAAGINTIFFQVRPAGDAFYASRIVPWSRFLTGEEGLAPEEQFDPLPEFIKIAHESNIDFHAWINPFRATMSLDTSLLAENHILKTNPELTFAYGNRYYLDPGLPETQAHVLNVIEEILDNYKVDGVHMDDYFYPYPVKGQLIPDSLAFKKYGSSYFDVEDWRRENINRFVEKSYRLVKSKKEQLFFSISPFGVWRNKDLDPKGSKTQAGLNSYDDLYADSRGWIKAGWLDAIIPQIYWEIGHPVADYKTLLNWWEENADSTNLIIGHAAYKLSEPPSEIWKYPNEIIDQVNLTFKKDLVKGHAFFRTKNVVTNPRGLTDSLRWYYAQPAILPKIKTDLPLSSTDIKLKKPRWTDRGLRLCFKVPPKAKLLQSTDPKYYALFRFKGEIIDFEKGEPELLFLTPRESKDRKFCFFDGGIEQGEPYSYLVVGVDYFNRRMRGGNEVSLSLEGKKVLTD